MHPELLAAANRARMADLSRAKGRSREMRRNRASLRQPLGWAFIEIGLRLVAGRPAAVAARRAAVS